MSIPFSTVWERVKIDGIFQVKIPVLSLGYEKGASSLAAEVPSLAGIVSSGETLLHIFITLDPPLAQPAAMKLKVRISTLNFLVF
jgi:coiled-coil and C2 domain-containing protein 2A